ncbi:hypothetical protein GCM10025768_05630 [Microbacterium pseudoresistens]|uniref:Uncharacterized protein n=1 Tax=Microbacterium pseudoresistens TaxID=640634 RepID=A0A7Y9JP75_9MICO|nr:hypothetical protein [Microbacterium pseudoresistens]NYD54399.1 hypothetical protein [Microbacterium pseudoresistens]
MSVDPTLSGKITSVRTSGSGNWLLTPQADSRDGTTSRSRFLDASDFGGWDECFPCLTADPENEAFPDHGQAWNAEYRSSTKCPERSQGSWILRGCELHREVTRELPHRSRLTYHARFPDSATSTRVLWAAHPQFVAKSLINITLRCGDAPYCRKHGTGVVLPSLSALVPKGEGKKIAVESCPSQIVLTLSRVDEAITLEWDGRVIPEFHIWYDNGLYAREPVISPQPTIPAGRGVPRDWTLSITSYRR